MGKIAKLEDLEQTDLKDASRAYAASVKDFRLNMPDATLTPGCLTCCCPQLAKQLHTQSSPGNSAGSSPCSCPSRLCAAWRCRPMVVQTIHCPGLCLRVRTWRKRYPLDAGSRLLARPLLSVRVACLLHEISAVSSLAKGYDLLKRRCANLF